MSIPLTLDQRQLIATHPQRVVVVSLLSDPAGPLGECAARVEDAPAAYLLALLYRRSRYEGVLHGKPAYEAETLFASRVRSTARRALSPADWGVALAKALGVRWEALSEDDRLWWRGESRRLSASPDGVSLLSDWSRLRRPASLADLITSAGIAADWIGQLRAHRDAQDTQEDTP